MRKQLAVCLAVCALLALAALYLWGPATVPAGQEPLLTLSNANFSDFQRAFDAHSDSPRMILLVSPT